VTVADTVKAWAPGHDLNDLEIDRSGDPILVTVAVTGVGEPPPAGSLAAILAEDLDLDVDVEVIYVAVDSGSAGAP
jgi:hypothetical protein